MQAAHPSQLGKALSSYLLSLVHTGSRMDLLVLHRPSAEDQGSEEHSGKACVSQQSFFQPEISAKKINLVSARNTSF